MNRNIDSLATGVKFYESSGESLGLLTDPKREAAAAAAAESGLRLPGKITFVAGTLGQGGAERQLYYILRALRLSGVSVRLLCLTRGEFWEEQIQALGVEVTWVGRSGWRLIRMVRILSEVRRDKPEVLQSQHFYTNLYVTGVARALGVKEVGAIRNNVTSEVGKSLLGRWSLRGPRWLAANSRAAVARAEGMGVGEARCYFLPNVVDTERFQPGAKRGGEPVRLLAVGRLVEQKRLDRFLEVMAEVRARAERPVEGVIVGAGPKREELERRARELGLGPEILEFRGGVEDTAGEYGRADILVLTSDWEGTPNVVLEAMASGLPVVATPVGGVAEVVSDGETGFVTERCEAGEISERVMVLVKDVGLRERMGREARGWVERHHSLESLPRALAGLYGRVMG